MRAGIALGSNLGDRLALLQRARARILASAMIAPPIFVSSAYSTSPVDCPPSSGEFLNAVMEVELKGGPLEFLRELRDIEEALGREQHAAYHAPRGIDLDLLYAGTVEVRTEELDLPHPRISSRRFVLAPLAEIRPELVLPGQMETIAELLAGLKDGDSAEIFAAQW